MLLAGHGAPAVLSSSLWPLDAHPGLQNHLSRGSGSCQAPMDRGLEPAPAGPAQNRMLCSVSARQCRHLGKGAGRTGMLPCPVPARDRSSSCWQSCGTHFVVLLGGFCPLHPTFGRRCPCCAAPPEHTRAAPAPGTDTEEQEQRLCCHTPLPWK